MRFGQFPEDIPEMADDRPVRSVGAVDGYFLMVIHMLAER